MQQDRLTVGSQKIYSGAIPEWQENNHWQWITFERQIDVVVGLKVTLNGVAKTIPLIAIELKSGTWLNTDELDKKSAIYGSLKELYPWIHTVFIMKSNKDRGITQKVILRNGRQFNTIYTDWDEQTQKLLTTLISQQLEYLIEYWQL